MTQENKEVTAKMITGAETGGQVYGKGRWDDVKIPKIGLEVTLTLGAYQFYGNEGRELLRMINLAGGLPEELSYCLDIDWVGERWVPGALTRHIIGMAISSELGIKKQVELFCDIQLPFYIKRAEEFGVFGEASQMMWVEIEHVGGLNAAKRIFTRCDGDYTLGRIMWSLKQDQNDHSSENQAGDKLYWSRHEFCRRCIEQYGNFETIPDELFDGVYIQV